MGNEESSSCILEEFSTKNSKAVIMTGYKPSALGPCGHNVNTSYVLSMVHSCFHKMSLDFSCPICGNCWAWEQVRGLIQRPATEVAVLDARVNEILQALPDKYRKCPVGAHILTRSLDSSGRPSPSAMCPWCPQLKHFCWCCQAPWLFSMEAGPGQCPNRSCDLVATLLACETITDTSSSVVGCPVFRSCPKCHCVIMHELDGCKYVACPSCKYKFCYICLKASKSCLRLGVDGEYYFTVCEGGIASRQRFVT